MKRFITPLVFAAFAPTAYHAQASFQTFTNKAEFLASCSATNCTGTLPQLGLCPGGPSGSFTAGRVTFTIAPPATELYSGDPGSDWTGLLPGPDIAISEREHLDAQFDRLVFSAGVTVQVHQSPEAAGCEVRAYWKEKNESERALRTSRIKVRSPGRWA